MADSVRQLARATADDLAALPDEVRAEVIGGEIVEKQAQRAEHGGAQIFLGALLLGPYQRGRGGPGGWCFFSDVEVELETHDVYRPDVVGWRRDRVPERPRGRPVRIRPDWVCEVISPSNARNDFGPKRETYARVGVPHYWLVDPLRETLTVLRRTADGYLVHLIAVRGDVVRAEPFEEIEISIAELFDGE